MMPEYGITPLLSEERADEPDGLWATKQYGDFQEGDRLRAEDYVTGSVEVRQLRSVYKLSFVDIVRVNRFKLAGDLDPSDGDDESDESMTRAKRAEREDSAVRLYVFLTKKKAKKRMADLEETAFLLRLDVGIEGCICFGKSCGSFDQGMLQVPDPTGYKGIVIAKRSLDEPKTEEPVVCAFAKIVQKRRPIMSSEVILGLAEDKDRVTRFAKASATVKTDEDLLKGARKYTRSARKAWEAMSIPEDQSIDFEGFKLALDELNIVVLEGRAQRLFNLCDLDGSGIIGVSELEVALMVHDVLPTTSYMTPVDLFHVFDLDGGGDISWVEFKEAADVISEGKVTEELAKELFDKVDDDKSGVIDYGEFKQAWIELIPLDRELKARGLKPAFGPMSTLRNKRALLKVVESEDETTEETFKAARARVDDVRKRARLLREEKRKRKAVAGGKATLTDANEDAMQRKQRRMMLQREQAERARQRTEQKIKQNELQQQLAAKKERDTVQIKQRMARQEKDRIAGIRARAEDQLWLSHQHFRQVPAKYYEDREWQKRLVDLVLLDLQDNRLTDLPSDFLAQMLSLRKLNLCENRLSCVPDEQLASLSRLQMLDLGRNELRELPTSMCSLLKLQHLNISRNQINRLPLEIGNMHALRSFLAHSNNLDGLPNSVGGLVSLELCDLSSNRLVALPNNFSYATALTRLDLSSNRLRHLPLDLGQLYSLQILDVSCNQLAGLPTSVSTLKGLQILKIGENAVVEVAEAWGGMTGLLDLEAPTNRIGRISPGIGGMVQLQRLNLRQNLVEELPPEIGLLTELHDLNLRSNRLVVIPDEMAALARLNRLSLAHNCVQRRLLDQIGMLTCLTHLDVSSNNIGHLPPSLGALEDLEILNVSKNVLTRLPQNFAFLTSLTELDLSCNRFSAIPMLLCGMPALRRLDMTSNIICRLPKEVASLTSLTKLHLRHNLIKSLPLEMVELEKHTEDLNVEQNPLSALPDKWHSRFGPKEETSRPAGYTTGEIFEWLRAQRAFHEHATDEWNQKAGLYLTGRASAKEFVEGVRGRVGEENWRSYLEPHVLRLYSRSKKNGLPDVHHEMAADELHERRRIKSALAIERELQICLCVADAEDRAEREKDSYSFQAVRSKSKVAGNRITLRREHLSHIKRATAI